MIYLTAADVARMAEAFGGDVRDLGLLESAVGNCQSTFDGVDLYPDVFHKAAALLVGIARNHAFIDGNKRTAFSATVVFLGLNGWDLDLEQGEVVNMTLAVAENALEGEKVAAILARNARRI